MSRENLPSSYAQGRVSRGEDLRHGHHLVFGNRVWVHEAGTAGRGRMVSERDVTDYTRDMVDWLD